MALWTLHSALFIAGIVPSTTPSCFIVASLVKVSTVLVAVADDLGSQIVRLSYFLGFCWTRGDFKLCFEATGLLECSLAAKLKLSFLRGRGHPIQLECLLIFACPGSSRFAIFVASEYDPNPVFSRRRLVLLVRSYWAGTAAKAESRKNLVKF